METKLRRRLAAAGASAAVALGLFAGMPAAALEGSPYNATDGVADEGVTPVNDLPTGPGDNAFGQGTHEDTTVPTVVSGSIPNNKADLLSFWSDTRKAAGGDYLYLAWSRVDSPSGSTNLDFEFNRSRTISSNGVTPVRMPGDLLITYEIPNGGTNVELGYRYWEGASWGAHRSFGDYAEGGFNTLTDGNRTYHTFGEAVINLTTSGLFPADNCVNFGSAYLKSRAAPSFNSELKDFIAPEPVNAVNCGTITIEKDTVPNDEQDFSFTAEGPGLSNFALDDDSNSTLSNKKTFVDVLSGTYSFTEAVESGFQLTDVSCTSTGGSSGDWAPNTTTARITLTPGGTVNCKFTNRAVPAELTVIKRVINDNAGTGSAGDFEIEVDGRGAEPASFRGNESGTTVTLDKGPFNVTEKEADGYHASLSGCSGRVNWGDKKTCTITNNDAAPGLTVIKHVINDNGGTADAGDFRITVSGAHPQPAAFPGDEEGTFVEIGAGPYSVTEELADGYAVTYSKGCRGVMQLGDSRICTVTNDDIRPKITVTKKVINDDGGTKQPEAFTMEVNGQNATPGAFAGSASGTEVLADAGPYFIAETGNEGYVATFSSGCDGTIDIGQTASCTVVNDDASPGLTVVKRVVNDNGGTAAAGDFTIEVEAGGKEPVSFPGDGKGTFVNLQSGPYTVTEQRADGYEASYSPDCEGSIATGESRVCTVTNDDIPPRLTVIKKVVNNNGGTKKPGDFTLSVDGAGPDPGSFAGSAAGIEVTIAAGEYKVTEAKAAGYTGTFSDDCTGDIDVGQTRTCTVTNTDEVGVEVMGKLETRRDPEVLGVRIASILGIPLPKTGLNSASTLASGLFLLALGGYLLSIGRRRPAA